MSATEQFVKVTPEQLPMVVKAVQAYLTDFPFVAFYGEMGSGKTTFIKALALLMGIKDEVSSPTFSLVNEYAGASGNPVYHFDFYRVRNLEEAFDIGYEEYFYSGQICLVEWPQVIEGLLPTPRLEVHIRKHDPDSRDFLIKTVI